MGQQSIRQEGPHGGRPHRRPAPASAGRRPNVYRVQPARPATTVDGMDPLIAGALVKAAIDAGSEDAKTTGGLLTRALGPTADVLGQALAQFTDYRLRNVGKIVGRSEKKARETGRTGSVHPRVAHRVIEEGSFCDDAVMADYLGGVLAGSRTPSGRDDRAVVWSDLVAGLSAAQIRLHYLLYREWAIRLHGRTEVNLGMVQGANQAVMYVELNQIVEALRVADDDREIFGVFKHAIVGLHRQGLVNEQYAHGARAQSESPDAPYEHVLNVGPSMAGIELYGWAQGLPGLTPSAFILEALPFDVDPPLRRLDTAVLPRVEGANTSAPSS
jgi:hypothetical protein